MSETKLLKFTFDGRVDGEVIYEAGKTYPVPVAGGSADRWIKRGAIEVTEDVAEVEAGENSEADTDLETEVETETEVGTESEVGDPNKRHKNKNKNKKNGNRATSNEPEL